jgi:two-component system response regulator GlrR
MPSRILIIDDDPAGLFALAEALVRRMDETIIVETALNTHAALDLLRNKEFQVIISDVRMEGLDGLALLNQVRERWPDISVILITGEGRDREAHALRHGAFAFVEKPLDVDRLLPTIKSAIERTFLACRVRKFNRHSHLHLSLEAGRMDLSYDPTAKKQPS